MAPEGAARSLAAWFRVNGGPAVMNAYHVNTIYRDAVDDAARLSVSLTRRVGSDTSSNARPDTADDDTVWPEASP